MMRRTAISAAVAITAAAALTGCASGGGSGSAPIKVGQITTISGGFPFGDVVKGTQSYINMLNANGGINGHQVSLVSGDDKADAAEAAQLARKMVQQDGVVGMVGNTSLVDAQANAEFYKANNIVAIGGGTQSIAFTSPNYVPVNAGPYVGHEVAWKYIFDQLKPKVPCAIEQNDPTSVAYYNQLFDAFEKANNVKFALRTYTNDATQNPTPAVTNAKSVGCDLVLMSTVAPNFAAFIQAAKTVGLDATFIVIGSGYDVSLPGTLGALGNPGALGPKDQGVFVAAELAPVDDPNKNVQEMVTQLKKDNVPANFWSEIGWLSAKLFFDGLAQNKNADVTTAKGVTTQLKAMSPVDTGFAASPLTVGPGDTHFNNLGSKVLTIKDGNFINAPGQTGGWTVVKAPAPFKG